ncbi:hypothetical protein ACFSUJ_24955 [Streptomyces lusitanus]|uniref:Uncharacterized protein n=1 Tax=Streptomyces lusitanus TaxID=68232 RepID=A0ABU3JZE8_9ACTN|nr:hypothetical protein [Streptomyces lusitanus]
MNFEELGSQAIALICDMGTSVAQDTASQVLADLVTQRLANRPPAAAAFMRLQRNPADAQLRTITATAVADEATHDADFARQLQQAIEAAGRAKSGGINISGSTFGRNTDIAGGNIDKSRRNIRVGFGALAALLVAGAASISFVTINNGDDNKPETSQAAAESQVINFLDDVAKGEIDSACKRIAPAELGDRQCEDAVDILLRESQGEEYAAKVETPSGGPDWPATLTAQMKLERTVTYFGPETSNSPKVDANHVYVEVEFSNGDAYGYGLLKQGGDWLIFDSTCMHACPD